MKRLIKSFVVFAALLSLFTGQNLFAQTKADIFGSTVNITWLGLDFSHAKFLGEATQFGTAGEISNSQIRERFIPGWNQLFINEIKKYDVAGAVRRTDVKYATDVTEKPNYELKNDFFTNKSDELNSLDEKK